MERQKLNIGLFGFGVVGQGLVEVLAQSKQLEASIHKICIKHPEKERTLPVGLFTDQPDALLYDPEINVIIELIDDAEASYHIVSTALKQGKAVVSANKKMIAHHFEELSALQTEYDVPLLYEAACCASIPIIRNLEEYYDNDLLDYIEGVVNGSTNYILTNVCSQGIAYSDALKDAQEKGFAESNPILDTGGFDSKYKLLIMIAHAFGKVLHPDQIVNVGIDRLGETELTYAKEKRYKIKLLAHAFKSNNGTVTSYVAPAFIRPDHPLYSVDDVYNGIITRTSFLDKQFFVGKGAGALPTASAVVADLSALSYHYRYEYKKLQRNQPSTLHENPTLRVFMRYPKDRVEDFWSAFQEIEESYLNQHSGYFIGTIELKTMQQLYSDEKDVSFVLV